MPTKKTSESNIDRIRKKYFLTPEKDELGELILQGKDETDFPEIRSIIPSKEDVANYSPPKQQSSDSYFSRLAHSLEPVIQTITTLFHCCSDRKEKQTHEQEQKEQLVEDGNSSHSPK